MRRFFAAAVLLLPLVVAPPASRAATDGGAEPFRLEERNEVEEVFNLIFGSAPPMATERGILVLEAYHDRNGDQSRGPEEEELENEIVCRIDEIDYSVPAFIPGLEYNGTYQMRCGGELFKPVSDQKTLFIKHRGEILHLALPCRLSGSAQESR